MSHHRILSGLLLVLTSLLAACKPPEGAAQLVLEVYLPPDYEATVVSNSPDDRLIEHTIQDLDWQELTFVVLKANDENGIELSGSLLPEDGLSARYWEDGREFVSARPPSSLEEGMALLQSYGRGDEQWRSSITWK